MSIVNEAGPQFDKSIDHLAQELRGLRTGRATPTLVEDLQIELYGAMQPLKAAASISTPDARTIQIEPWDASAVKAIESAIMKSDIGINPNVDGKTIRLNMPMMTDEMRQEMVKKLKAKMEDARVSIRRVREDVKKKIEGQDGIGDDDKHAQLDELEKTVKQYNEQIDGLGKKKEEEITTI